MTEIPFLLLNDNAPSEFNLCLVELRFNEIVLFFYDLKKGGDPGWQGDATLICQFVIREQSRLDKLIHFMESEDFIPWERLNSYSNVPQFRWWVKREYESPSMSYNQHEEWAANYHAS